MYSTSTRKFKLIVSALAALVSGANVAYAQTNLPPASTTESTELGAICTDRPTKSNFACVIETGHFQYEADFVNASRLSLDGTRTESVTALNPTLKYGLAPNVDIEINGSPAVSVRTRDASGTSTTLRGISDTTLRAKWNFLNDSKSGWSATLLPWVKAPTARRGIGNRAVEGGLIVPVNYQVTDNLVLTTAPEFDALKDTNGSGRHFSTSQLVNLGWSLSNGVTLYGELWGSWNFDRPTTVRQYSADVAVAKSLGKFLQLDAGLNFGLNRFTPGVQGYFGISQKF